MVELKEKELIIRIKTDYPEEDLKEFQGAIIYALEGMDDEFLHHNNIYPIFTLLRALLPDEDQLKKLRK